MRQNLKQTHRRVSEVKDTLNGTLRFAKALPEFFRKRLVLQQAEEEIKRALDRRNENFLELARRQIYQQPHSLYLSLLKLAGCEFSDLRVAVRKHGLEETLLRLATEGVYLTASEFKGKKEIVRGQRSFRVSRTDFRIAQAAPGFIAENSGTSGQPLRAVISLDRVAAGASTTALFLAAHELFSRAHAVYDAVLPANGSLRILLTYAKLGISTERWFALNVPANNRFERCYHYLITYLVMRASRRYGPGLPCPELVDSVTVTPIARWLSENKRNTIRSCITTPASNAARVARLAWESGMSLAGTTFIANSEPFTEAKRETIERVGAKAVPTYGFADGGQVGFGCANPSSTDDVHVNGHSLAVIPNPKALADSQPTIFPLLFTTLYASAPMLLFNVENGDYATLSERRCGCALGRVGFTSHLSRIRSYEKFTSEGMNYFYGDLFEVFEKTLPGEFGGGPGDYQLIEEEDSVGQTRLTLVVHPRVGALDDGTILTRLTAALSNGSRGNRFMSEMWQSAGTFRVTRDVPHASPRGKILPLHFPRAKTKL